MKANIKTESKIMEPITIEVTFTEPGELAIFLSKMNDTNIEKSKNGLLAYGEWKNQPLKPENLTQVMLNNFRASFEETKNEIGKIMNWYVSYE